MKCLTKLLSSFLQSSHKRTKWTLTSLFFIFFLSCYPTDRVNYIVSVFKEVCVDKREHLLSETTTIIIIIIYSTLLVKYYLRTLHRRAAVCMQTTRSDGKLCVSISPWEQRWWIPVLLSFFFLFCLIIISESIRM